MRNRKDGQIADSKTALSFQKRPVLSWSERKNQEAESAAYWALTDAERSALEEQNHLAR